MIRRLILRWQLERALARRRQEREAHSRAAKQGASTAIHNRFARDILMREAGRA
ncbi:hypothetical protein [Sphingomonas sp.]|uniref:hypothetical protein n=1 Tax=Sphingomonas sp. TaxID=28214 RepID=UPI003B3B4924